jgi:hypothetical protein
MSAPNAVGCTCAIDPDRGSWSPPSYRIMARQFMLVIARRADSLSAFEERHDTEYRFLTTNGLSVDVSVLVKATRLP